MNVRENDRVQVVGDIFDGKVGTVKSVYNSLGMAVVKFDEGVAKVPLSCLVKIKSQENAEPKTEIPEGAKKISRADFEVALIDSSQYMASRVSSHPLTAVIGSSIGTIVGANIADKIFKDQDVVVMTEDQFVAELWVNCNPKAVGEMIGNLMNLGNNMDVAIAAIMNLRKIPGILFEADNG